MTLDAAETPAWSRAMRPPTPASDELCGAAAPLARPWPACRAGKAPRGGCGEFGEGDWGEEGTFEGFNGKNRGCAFAEGMCAICAKRTAGAGKVEVWRGDVRLSMSVPAPFVWRCLSGSAVAPFPHPAHRTGRADFPHPALGQDLTPSSRATPSAASEHHLELIGCPISMSFATFCVCLELRSLPSAGVTRFPRYYEPLRHPRAPGLSLTGVRLVLSSLT